MHARTPSHGWSTPSRLPPQRPPARRASQIERAPPPEPVAYESPASTELPDDSMVITLSKAKPGEWPALYAAGSGTSARKEEAPLPPPPPPKRKPATKPAAKGGNPAVGFVPRKMRLFDGERERARGGAAAARAAAEPAGGVAPSVPAAEHWQSEGARYLWPAGLAEVRGALT